MISAGRQAELLAELRAEAEHFGCCGLLVGFARRTEFVRGDDPEAAEHLDALIAEGGAPVAFYVAEVEADGVLDIYVRPMPEVEGQSWFDDYIAHLFEGFEGQPPRIRRWLALPRPASA